MASPRIKADRLLLRGGKYGALGRVLDWEPLPNGHRRVILPPGVFTVNAPIRLGPLDRIEGARG